jgi:MoaA/NifB/PqqE/SkfB family radical SAM enzyme
MSEDRDYYCSYKFKYLKIDLVSNNTLNCHAAKSHAINFSWLNANPGQLFNTQINVAERQMMLNNQRNASCEEICWPLEDKGAVSPRMWQNGKIKTHANIHTQPEILEIKLNDDCNLSCSYCCKEYSSAWRRDLASNGNFAVDTGDARYKLTSRDKIMMKVSQQEVKNTKQFQMLMSEIKSFAPGLREIVVTGGEPLLDNQLFDVLDAVSNSSAVINIYTGLGVDIKRFQRMLDKIKQIPTAMVSVSAECTDKFYEFNRYGSRWADFVNKIELLQKSNIEFRFSTAISNLTVLGLASFIKYFSNQRIGLVFVNQPSMMAPYVLDADSKHAILQDIQTLPEHYKTQIAQSIQADPSEIQRQQMSEFLKEYAARRNLDTSIYPTSFLEWLNIHVVQ